MPVELLNGVFADRQPRLRECLLVAWEGWVGVVERKEKILGKQGFHPAVKIKLVQDF